jgi:hypothetical protein
MRETHWMGSKSLVKDYVPSNQSAQIDKAKQYFSSFRLSCLPTLNNTWNIQDLNVENNVNLETNKYRYYIALDLLRTIWG